MARGVGQLHAVSAHACGLICAVQGGEACACAEASHLQLSLPLSANLDSAAPSAKRDLGATSACAREGSEAIEKECASNRQSVRERACEGGYRQNAAFCCHHMLRTVPTHTHSLALCYRVSCRAWRPSWPPPRSAQHSRSNNLPSLSFSRCMNPKVLTPPTLHESKVHVHMCECVCE